MSNAPVISSTQNELVKIARSLHDKKGRTERHAFLVEGEKCVDELVTHMPHLLQTLIVTIGSKKDLIERVTELGKRVVTVEPHVMRSLCDCKTPQSASAIANIPSSIEMKTGFIVALDNLADPANVGTIIRTADAAGCSGVLLSFGTTDPFAPKAVRASMGSLFHLPVIRADLRSHIVELRKNGFDIACADLRGTEDFCLENKKTCLVIGNESHGISEEILDMATARIRIPIYGKAESLNAAVAAGILIYKIRT